MSTYNLPPGVTTADIDRSAGEYSVECQGCDQIKVANTLNEKGLCEACVIERYGPACVGCLEPTFAEVNGLPCCEDCFVDEKYRAYTAFDGERLAEINLVKGGVFTV